MNAYTLKEAKRQEAYIRSWGLFTLGMLMACITGYALFQDVLHGSPITVSHVTSFGALVATVAAGHFIWPEARAGRLGVAFGCAIVFLAGTVYVGTTSAARNAEVTQGRAAAARDVNGKRAEQIKLKSAAQAMLAAAIAKCGTGRRCAASTQATIDVYTAAIAGHDAMLDKLGPERAENGGYAEAAKAMAAIPYVTASAAAIEQRLVLLMPWLVVLICEISIPTFLGGAIGRRTVSGTVSAPEKTVSRPVLASTLTDTDDYTDEELEQLRRLLQAAKRPLNNNRLAELMDVTKGEASKRVTAAMARGMVSRRRVGREVAISLH